MSVADTSQALNKLGDIRTPEIDTGRPTPHSPPSAGFFMEIQMANFVLPQPVQNGHGDLEWRRDEIHACVAADIADHNGIDGRAKRAAEKFDLANDVVKMAEKEFGRSIDRLVETEKRLGDVSKRVSGTIRKAADDLRGGLEKVQKTANFSVLEKQVELLERAATALSALAALEKDGKLDRILAAIK